MSVIMQNFMALLRYGDFSIFQNGGRPPSWTVKNSKCYCKSWRGSLVLLKAAKHRLRQDHKDKWMTKMRHGQFLRQMREVVDLKKWAWLTLGNLKMETEGFLMATCWQSPYLHKPAIVIVTSLSLWCRSSILITTSLAAELATTPLQTYKHRDTLPRLIYKDDCWLQCNWST